MQFHRNLVSIECYIQLTYSMLMGIKLTGFFGEDGRSSGYGKDDQRQ
jgi:hypothetical protein